MEHGFFKNVMSVNLSRPAQIKVKKKAVPKKKGKKPKPQKPLKGKSKDPTRIFKAVLEADAGEDPSHQKQSFFDQHLAGLSEKELRKLQKKVENIRKHFLFDPEKSLTLEDANTFIQQLVDQRVEQSKQKTLFWRRKIYRKLEGMDLRAVTEDKKIVAVESAEGIKLLRRFAKDHFSEETKEWEKLVKSGEIIPERKGLTPNGNTAREIKNWFNYIDRES